MLVKPLSLESGEGDTARYIDSIKPVIDLGGLWAGLDGPSVGDPRHRGMHGHAWLRSEAAPGPPGPSFEMQEARPCLGRPCGPCGLCGLVRYGLII